MSIGSDENSIVHLKADIIILGSKLPGLATAYRLKKCLGQTYTIVVLCTDSERQQMSMPTLTFGTGEQDCKKIDNQRGKISFDVLVDEEKDNPAYRYILKYADEFLIELPQTILYKEKEHLRKVFQYADGEISCSYDSYHDFNFVNRFERFELKQFQDALNANLESIYMSRRRRWDCSLSRLFDSKSMEEYIKECLFLKNSRDIMRMMVKVVCGENSKKVSVLFYLHQCMKVDGAHKLIGSNEIRMKTRVYSALRDKITHMLTKNVADITVFCNRVCAIKTFSKNQVMIETINGEYICRVLAMAMRPDIIKDIEIDPLLFQDEKEKEKVFNMETNIMRKFVIEYEMPFWKANGYCGDIFSICGPIIWATEMPNITSTGSVKKYHKLIGILNVEEEAENNETEVIQQLVNIFGLEAANVKKYRESNVADLFISKCGDLIDIYKILMRHLEPFETKFKFDTNNSKTNDQNNNLKNASAEGIDPSIQNDLPKILPDCMEWGSLDLYGDGDLNASLEAGNRAFVAILYRLRPQAQLYDDVVSLIPHTLIETIDVQKYTSGINYCSAMRTAVVLGGFYLTYQIVRTAVYKLLVDGYIYE